jgi:SAM-dependent methyltransferase
VNADYRAQLWDYYDRRAAVRDRRALSNQEVGPQVRYALEYWRGLGVDVSPSEIEAENAQVRGVLSSLESTRFLEVGTGPGTYTAMIPGRGIALDQSDAALRILRSHSPRVPTIRADAFCLPLRERCVGRVFATHLYGLLDESERMTLLNEARRVASQIIVLDAGRPAGVPAEQLQERGSGSDHVIYRVLRRHFEAAELADEIGGHALYAGRFYVVAACAHSP